jgi:hypothetical protein
LRKCSAASQAADGVAGEEFAICHELFTRARRPLAPSQGFHAGGRRSTGREVSAGGVIASLDAFVNTLQYDNAFILSRTQPDAKIRTSPGEMLAIPALQRRPSTQQL